MKKFRADLHIHSVLSPCASLEMSPKKIVEAARKKEIDIIGIADHNSIWNLETFSKLADDDLHILYGMELQTESESHLLILFDDYNNAYNFGTKIYDKLPDIENKPDIFGDQPVVDEKDNILRFEKKLLLQSVLIDIYEAFKLAKKYNGLVIPSHINRDTYSIVSQLGFIPEDIKFDAFEIDKNMTVDSAISKYGREYIFVKNSDAHYLKDIGTATTNYHIKEVTIEELKKAFNSLEGRKISYDG